MLLVLSLASSGVFNLLPLSDNQCEILFTRKTNNVRHRD